MTSSLHWVWIVTLLVSSLEASASRGKEIYADQCASCHLNAKAMAGQRHSKEWKRFFKADGLSQFHLGKQEAKPSWKYFQSEAYQQDAKHLKHFFLKYSSDLGKHSSCL